MSVVIKPVDKEHLSKVLKEANVRLTPRETQIIDRCHNLISETWVGYNNGELICAWGIIPPTILSDEVYLWLQTTQAVDHNQFLFVRHSQLFIERVLKEYRAVIGFVKADARHSQKWLKWLGATIEGPPKKGMLTFRIERHG
jgi:hypothetical protein